MTRKYKVKTPIGDYYAWTSDSVNGGFCTSLLYPESDSQRLLSAPGAIEPKTYKCKHFPGLTSDETHVAMNEWLKAQKGFGQDVVLTEVEP